MTKLLVSVRNAVETALALDAGVDLIDLKEPLAGALGSVPIEFVHDVAGLIGDRLPLSAALGELVDYDTSASANLPNSLRYAKVGLSGCAQVPVWHKLWQRFAESLPPATLPVAVAYADASRAAAPTPLEVIQRCVPLGAKVLLIDTWGKEQGGLLDFLSYSQLGAIVAAAREYRLMVALAGSLTPLSVQTVLPLAPDVVAFRGAVCRGGRSGTLDRERICGLVELLRQQTLRQPHPRNSAASSRVSSPCEFC